MIEPKNKHHIEGITPVGALLAKRQPRTTVKTVSIILTLADQTGRLSALVVTTTPKFLAGEIGTERLNIIVGIGIGNQLTGNQPLIPASRDHPVAPVFFIRRINFHLGGCLMNVKIPKRPGTAKLASICISAARITRFGEKCARNREQTLCAQRFSGLWGNISWGIASHISATG